MHTYKKMSEFLFNPNIMCKDLLIFFIPHPGSEAADLVDMRSLLSSATLNFLERTR